MKDIIRLFIFYIKKYLYFCIPKSIKFMSDLRDEIVNKSFLQFLNRGYKACSLRDLEAATGLTKGAFYYYFRNKEEILKAGIEKYLSVCEEMSEEEFLQISSLREYIDRIIERKEEISRKLQELFDYFIIEVAFFQLVLEVGTVFPEYRSRIDEVSKNRLSRWEYMILRAKQQDEIKVDLDTSVLARNLMSVATSMLNIELGSENMRFTYSDMRMQFEQYYLLIRR